MCLFINFAVVQNAQLRLEPAFYYLSRCRVPSYVEVTRTTLEQKSLIPKFWQISNPKILANFKSQNFEKSQNSSGN